MNLILFHFLNGLAGHTIIIDKIIIFLAVYSPAVYVLLMIVQWFLCGDKGKKASVKAFFAAVIAMALNLTISKIYFEPRPFVHHKVNLLVKHPADASFPSDHAAFGSALAFTEIMYDKVIGSIMMILTIILLFARVYVGVHYPIDMIGGFLVGYISSKIVKYGSFIFNPIETFVLNMWHKVFSN
ncbi:MAG: undecaprenyl-diphosphatase [Thermoanaerobacteraceae bacterium]|nr:undecaprenyl-diphosphatase [Thermoanaerobacteraceae bacterium]